jgi:hypothetical protein
MALFLMKLKLNLAFTVLAAAFSVSEGTASHWFYDVLAVMTKVARTGVWWFDKATVQARMPASFRGLYPETRCIIDASEVRCQRPRTQRQRAQVMSE